METKIIFVGDLPLEEQQLDAAGAAARERLNALAFAEYEQSGSLTSSQLGEAVAEFEAFAARHIKQPGETENPDQSLE